MQPCPHSEIRKFYEMNLKSWCSILDICEFWIRFFLKKKNFKSGCRYHVWTHTLQVFCSQSDSLQTSAHRPPVISTSPHHPCVLLLTIMSDEISRLDCKAACLHSLGRTSRSTWLRGWRKRAEGSGRKASRCVRDQRLKLTLKSFLRQQPVQAGKISFLLFWQHVALPEPWSHQLPSRNEQISFIPHFCYQQTAAQHWDFLYLDRTVTPLSKYLIHFHSVRGQILQFLFQLFS